MAPPFKGNGNTIASDQTFMSSFGGLFKLSYAQVTFKSVTFLSGSADQGGAIHATESEIFLDDVTFQACTATSNGGAIWAIGGRMDVFNTYFVNNWADEHAGAIKFTEQFGSKFVSIFMESNTPTDMFSGDRYVPWGWALRCAPGRAGPSVVFDLCTLVHVRGLCGGRPVYVACGVELSTLTTPLQRTNSEYQCSSGCPAGKYSVCEDVTGFGTGASCLGGLHAPTPPPLL
eukprot:CAMPEP_0119533444 /NCGR_PEP_ID=MMETSP1344-20130328/46839_1 /TAXON_ID=236787 /ORGANISM="Florenciella parvula, Strain CCMP2471" /LENGTH=230 /DNA_ID=CAMNT_0007574331 /DNA_START=382 /DNA_END=1071 /DNA_ORIENTATION=+